MVDKVNRFDFNSSNDLVQKLSRTVVLHNGSLVYIEGVEHWNKENSTLLARTPKNARVVIPLKEIDYQSPILGMFYSPFYKSAVTVSRGTSRQYRGGIPLESLRVTEAGKEANILGAHGNHLSIVLTDDFVNMVYNKYRDIPTCINLLKEGSSSVPFRRFHWIKNVFGNYLVYFKDRPIIMLGKTGNTIKEFSEDCSCNAHLTKIIPKEIEEIRRELSNG